MSEAEFLDLTDEIVKQVRWAHNAVNFHQPWTNYQQSPGTQPVRYRIGDFEIIDRRVVDPDPPKAA